MKFEALEHRGEAWYERRLGMPTASQFHRIITPKGGKSTQADLYEAELIGERIFNRPMGKDISGIPAVAHGIEHEAEAAQVLESILGTPLSPGGFMTDDSGSIGCSPDRLLIKGNRREIVEIKCPQIPQQIKSLICGMGEDYRAQVQGQLLISGFDAANYFSYHPSCPPYHQRVERDQWFIGVLDALLEEFSARLEADYQRALKMGVWGT